MELQDPGELFGSLMTTGQVNTVILSWNKTTPTAGFETHKGFLTAVGLVLFLCIYL
jgi:hypothetical protein